MKYNPHLHHRRSVRLRGNDYGREGMCFVTICTYQRALIFGSITDGQMELSPFGVIAYQEWEQLPERWPHVTLGAFQVMPNHMHGILVIERPVSGSVVISSDAPTDPSEDIPFSKIQWAARPSLGQIIGAYKSSVSTECLRYHKENAPGVWLDKIWQRNYDDRLIRDAKMWENVTRYIINNPENWKSDMFFIPPNTSL